MNYGNSERLAATFPLLGHKVSHSLLINFFLLSPKQFSLQYHNLSLLRSIVCCGFAHHVLHALVLHVLSVSSYSCLTLASSLTGTQLADSNCCTFSLPGVLSIYLLLFLVRYSFLLSFSLDSDVIFSEMWLSPRSHDLPLSNLYFFLNRICHFLIHIVSSLIY